MSAAPQEQGLLGRYSLHEPIASGGMATVHIGRVKGARGFARTVAIKRLHPQFAKDPAFSSMLLDEARLAGAIRHANVVPTLDVVQADGELFMVMEYVPGESLARLLLRAREGGARVPAPIGAAIVAGALAGLHAAHEARTEDGIDLHIVHRDVSPQNILVGRDGIPRLVDFGIARAAVRSQATREGQLKGKLRYMAPEQLRGGRETDRRADIYAAGVVLWEVFTGEKLFDGESDAEVFGSVLEGVVTPPSALADLPEELDRIVLRAVARDPEERFTTALSMAEALLAALPPASAAEVGAWVDALVGDVLAERAGYIAALEAPPSSAAPSAGGAPPPSSAQGRLESAPSSARGRLDSAPPSARGRLDSAPPSSGLRLRRAPLPSEPTRTRTVMRPALADAPQLKHAARSAAATFAPSLGSPRARRALAWIGAVIALAAAAFALHGPRPDRAAPAPATSATAPEGAPTSALPAPDALAPSAPASAAPPVAATASARPPRPRLKCVPPYYVDGAGIRRVKRECL